MNQSGLPPTYLMTVRGCLASPHAHQLDGHFLVDMARTLLREVDRYDNTGTPTTLDGSQPLPTEDELVETILDALESTVVKVYMDFGKGNSPLTNPPKGEGKRWITLSPETANRILDALRKKGALR